MKRHLFAGIVCVVAFSCFSAQSGESLSSFRELRYEGVMGQTNEYTCGAAGVAGRVWGGGVLYRTEDSPHFTPGDWATDTLYPSWAGTYVEVNACGSYQCGQISVELLREPTGYKWEFWFNICKGSVPW
jgi:hypothetical protein